MVEFDSDQIAKIAQEIGLERDFEVTDSDLHIEGYCPNCKKAMGD